MTLDEFQNKVLTQMSAAHPKSANVFEITEDILSKHNGEIPKGPAIARLLENGYIDSSGDAIGHYKITTKGKKFIAEGGFRNETPTDIPKKNFWQRLFKK